MPVVQLDWNKIKMRLGDVTAMYALTHRQASLLLSISEQLTWRKTFRFSDYEFDDWDLVEGEVGDIRRNLTMPVDVEDFVTALNAIKNAIDAQAALMGEEECCENVDFSDGELFTDFVEEGVGDVPANVVSAGYASDSSDWDGYDDYKCVISYVMVWNLAAKAERMQGIFDTAGAIAVGVGAIAGILGLIFGGPAFWTIAAISVTTGAAALVFEALADEGEGITEGLVDEILDNIDALSCAFYLGDGAEGSVDSLNDEIEVIWDAPVSTLLTNMNMISMAKALYAGRYDQVNLAQKLDDYGLDAESVECGNCADEDYSPMFVFLTSLEAAWITGDAYWHSQGNPGGGMLINPQGATKEISVQSLRTHVGLSTETDDTVSITKIEFDWKAGDTSSRAKIQIYGDSQTQEIYPASGAAETWYEGSGEWTDPPIIATHPKPILIKASRTGASAAIWFDNVKIYFTAQ